MSDRPVTAYWRALRCVMPLMAGGMVVSAVGGIFKNDWVMKAGLVAFFSGVALCGMANVIALGWSFIATARRSDCGKFVKDAREEPRPWIMMAAIFLLYATLGVGGLVLILLVLGVFR